MGHITERAKELRQRLTDTERLMWYRLRDRRLGGFKFRRQRPVGNYIVDFICIECRLVIELDGSQHNEETHKQYDQTRDSWLRDDGFLVIRFWNCQIFQDLDSVLDFVLKVLSQRHQERSVEEPTKQAQRNQKK